MGCIISTSKYKVEVLTNNLPKDYLWASSPALSRGEYICANIHERSMCGEWVLFTVKITVPPNTTHIEHLHICANNKWKTVYFEAQNISLPYLNGTKYRYQNMIGINHIYMQNNMIVIHGRTRIQNDDGKIYIKTLNKVPLRKSSAIYPMEYRCSFGCVVGKCKGNKSGELCVLFDDLYGQTVCPCNLDHTEYRISHIHKN